MSLSQVPAVKPRSIADVLVPMTAALEPPVGTLVVVVVVGMVVAVVVVVVVVMVICFWVLLALPLLLVVRVMV